MRQINPLHLDSGYRSPWLSYNALFLYAIIEIVLLYFLILKGPFYTYDSPSYLLASDYVSKGVPDFFRTPVYPIVYYILHLLCGESWDVAMVLLQTLIFLISSIYLVKIGEEFIQKKRIVFWLVTFYLLYPGFSSFACYIMTEIFAVSFLIFYTWSVLRLLKIKPTLFSLLIPHIWIFLLIFLRPVFIYLIPVDILFLIILIYGKRLTPIKSLVSFGYASLVILSVICYRNEVKRLYDISSMSVVTTVNNYHAIRYARIIDPSLTDNPNLKTHLDTIDPMTVRTSRDSICDELGKIYKNVDFPSIDKYEQAAIKKYPLMLAKGLTFRWGLQSYQEQAAPNIEWFPGNVLSAIIAPNMGLYCLLCCIFSIWTIVTWIKKRRCPYHLVILLMIYIGLFLTVMIGAETSYPRLNLPGFPIFLIVLGKFFSLFKRDYSHTLY